MTSSLPPEVREVFERFITTEYTTVDARQQPITWPVTPYYEPGAATIDVTTGIGYPKKADDAERNPRSSLFFSDPTGAGIERPPTVLVQGTGRDRRPRPRRERRALLCASRARSCRRRRRCIRPKPMRRLLSWYYARLYIKVRPERVFVWPDGDQTREPTLLDAHMEEVRSGHSEEPAAEHAPTQGGEARWDARLSQLGERYDTAVLTWVGPDGFPISFRFPVEADESARRIRIGAEPTGLPLAEGRACVAAHRHHPDFEWQQNFQVRGDLVREGGGWAVVPRRFVGGIEVSQSAIARTRMFIERTLSYSSRARRRLRAALGLAAPPGEAGNGSSPACQGPAG